MGENRVLRDLLCREVRKWVQQRAYVGTDGAIKRGHCQVSHHPAADSFSLASADDWLFLAAGPMWATRVRHLWENQIVSINWIIIDPEAVTVIELQ
ncbi:hypothetical protein QQF64_017309 [Cirrhinus molitorella]|uniref:Uncharacterized protein n=1 Tax=Cirrhinus molitorella TaxID=172907 RepID=A0ABR3LKM9_9TELE